MTDREELALKQMTLGEIIEALEKCDREDEIFFDFAYLRPCGVHSYCGYYSDLSIGYSNEGDVTVGKVLDMLKDAVGKNVRGWKGGNYKMPKSTPVWVDNYGEGGGTAVIGVEKGVFVHLITARIE